MTDQQVSLDFKPDSVSILCTAGSRDNTIDCTHAETIKKGASDLGCPQGCAKPDSDGQSTAKLDQLDQSPMQQKGLMFLNVQVPILTHTEVIPYNCELYQMKMPIVPIQAHIVCSDCRRGFSSKERFDSHLCPCKPQKKVCDVCYKSFQSSKSLKMHLRIHTWEKNFACEVCDMRFSEVRHLMRHCKIHTAEKPFACDLCQKRFPRGSSLKKHMLIHKGDKPFSCEVCRKRFPLANGIVRHMRTHTGEKPFACELCQKRFSSSSNLTRHRRVHTGERPYVCEVCHRGFSESRNLKNHMFIHEREALRLGCVSEKELP